MRLPAEDRRRQCRLGIVACLLLALAGPAAGQAAPGPAAGQADDGAGERSEAAALVERAESAVAHLHDRGIYPEVGSIVSGSGLSAGFGWRHHALGGSPLGVEVESAWSIRGYHAYTGRFGLLTDIRRTVQLARADANVDSLVEDGAESAPGLALYVEAAHRRYPRVEFSGLGPALGRPETDFALTGPSADLVVQWQPIARIGLSVRAGVQAAGLGPGTNDDLPNLESRYAPAAAPGLRGQPAWATLGLAVVGDTRDHPGVPARGVFLAGVVRRFAPLDATGQADGARAFTRASIDGRAYVPLASARHVVAARVLLSADRHAPGGVTPFYLQAWLGGSQTLRGFDSYQFRGETLVHASVEYRWRLVARLDVAPFVDAGAVAGAAGLSDSLVRVTPGLGVRVRSDEDVYVRLEWAHGDAGHRVLLSFGPAF